MDEEEFYDEDADEQGYAPLSEIDRNAMRVALCKLGLLGDDPFLRMQSFNLGIVDGFLLELEEQVLQRLIDEERTPIDAAAFLSAQSQMWIFAAYELLRTWRQRTREMIKWYENAGLELKLKAIERDLGFQHFGRSYRADQIRAVIEDPSLVDRMHDDRRRTHMLFARLEAIRVSLAKHEMRGLRNSIARTPGYGRINMFCGSLDFELENDQYSMGYVNRRDISDDIRALFQMDALPTDEEIGSFEAYLRGPTKEVPD